MKRNPQRYQKLLNFTRPHHALYLVYNNNNGCSREDFFLDPTRQLVKDKLCTTKLKKMADELKYLLVTADRKPPWKTHLKVNVQLKKLKHIKSV